MIVKVFGGILTAFLLTFIFILSVYNHAKQKAIHLTKHIKSTCLATKNNYYVNNYYKNFNTGDIVFMQNKSNGLYKWKELQFVPIHCGMIYIKNNIVYILEATNFETFQTKDYLWDRKYGGGIRLIQLSEVFNHVDQFLALRPLKKTCAHKFNLKKLEFEIENWAKYINFDNETMNNFIDLIVLGIVHAYPQTGKFYYKIKQKNINLLDKNNLNENIICSEFITKLLQKLGHINKNFKDHWILSPLNLTFEANKLNLLSKNSEIPLEWEKEISLTCFQK